MATLNIEYDFDFTLIGIYCHYKDYRLAWRFNHSLNWRLKKEEDHIIQTNSVKQEFPLFTYGIEDQEVYHYLIGNRSDHGNLIPERKDVDYFLLIDGLFEDNSKHNLISEIKGLEGVLSAIDIDPEELRSKQNLLIE